MRPRAQAFRWPQAQRLVGAVGVDRQCPQHVRHFGGLDAPAKRDSPQVVPVEPPGKVPQHGMLGIGRHPLDDELLARNAQRQGRAVFEQETRSPADGGRGRSEGRMALGVHRVLVQGDRQFDKKIGEVARQRRAAVDRTPSHHCASVRPCV